MSQTLEFYTAWWWLYNHPAFFFRGSQLLKIQKERKASGVYIDDDPGFSYGLDVFVAKVNPKTRRIDNDKAKNTKTEIWLEATIWATNEELPDDFHGQACHDIDLDCGGDTYEQAILKLAGLVYHKYGTSENNEGISLENHFINVRSALGMKVTGEPLS